ncbi:hypothetical protein SESBI_03058 [Sesbania bispinosa]|nr:hypothetical protein SESBI_03058 [Sesbania bispinosa]
MGEAKWVGSGATIYSPLIKKAEDLEFLEKQDGLASLQIIEEVGVGGLQG